MNILLVSLSVNGAMGDSFKCVAKGLSKNNNTFVLTNYKISSEDVGSDNICNLHFDKKKPFDFISPQNYLKARKYIKSLQYDVCLVFSPHPANLAIYCWLDKDKTVAYVHDHYRHSGISFANLVSQKLNHYLFYKKSRMIMVACRFIKEDILKRGLMNDASRIEICELGLLSNFCFPVTEKAEDVDVLFFGRIKYYKGLDVLVKSASRLNKVKFVIAGKGNLKGECGIEHLPENCIHINRYVPDDELAKLIQRSKIVVLPYRDATGTQTIQSIFYYNKPIIATNVGCFPEYITNGTDGIIVEPENEGQLSNAIQELLDDEKKRRQYGEEGRKKLDTIFSNDRITKRYEEIFCSIK